MHHKHYSNAQPSQPPKFSVILLNGPTLDKKIQFIKAIREVSGLGLKESKDSVELMTQYNAPAIELRKEVSVHCAFHAREYLERMGFGHLVEFRDQRNNLVRITADSFGGWIVSNPMTGESETLPRVFNSDQLWKPEMHSGFHGTPCIIGAANGRPKYPAPSQQPHPHPVPKPEIVPPAPPKGRMAPTIGAAEVDVDALNETDMALLVLAWTRKNPKYENNAAHFVRELFLKKNHESNGR